MATRRALWPRARLNGLSSLIARHDPLVKSKRLTQNPSHQAFHASIPISQEHRFSELMPPPADGTELEALLSAIQKKEAARIHEAFVIWTEPLCDRTSPDYSAVVKQVQEIPGPTFSEIIRSVDPLLSSAHDVAYGLNLTLGQTQFIDTRNLVDKFGVRRIHRRVLSGIEGLMEARGGSRYGLTPADYEVFMRCAGAAVDYQQAKSFWASMATHGQNESRTASTWNEFIKARFLTDPVYYQFDRSRVAVLARDLYSNHSPMSLTTIKRLDHMRLSLNAFKLEPWNRRPDEIDEDMRRLFRRRGDFRGFKNHWIRSIYYGHDMDEDLLCTSMIAFARSSSLHSIKTLILERYYGVQIQNASNPAEMRISGEAFGSMSQIALGSRLLDFFSRRYNIPIPHETWSNLLSWTYLCASKPFKPMRQIHGLWPSTIVTGADVRQVWDIMTSEPYNVTPTFDDLDIYIKTLITQRSYNRAISFIRERAIPHYDAVLQDYQAALFDEILQTDTVNNSSPIPTPSEPRLSHRRKQAEIRKDRTHHLISTWFAKILHVASENKSHRDGHFMHVLVPNLLLEFPDFFHPQVRYRTAQGEVQLERPNATARFDWAPGFRTTLPQKVAGIFVRDYESSDESEFPYPMTHSLRVYGWKRRPRERAEVLKPAPMGKGEEAKKWWGELEEQLML
ncbi:hypothetical protein PT974_04914 [Cladobotryum mycophilum]|uniref:Mitochondrial ATPase expression-domain-containing protein n=1 Tax=Cladobotryum mycophilum TaxID=491253 RepID=A0ABR0SRT6_9HYPO